MYWPVASCMFLNLWPTPRGLSECLLALHCIRRLRWTLVGALRRNPEVVISSELDSRNFADSGFLLFAVSRTLGRWVWVLFCSNRTCRRTGLCVGGFGNISLRLCLTGDEFLHQVRCSISPLCLGSRFVKQRLAHSPIFHPIWVRYLYSVWSRCCGLAGCMVLQLTLLFFRRGACYTDCCYSDLLNKQAHPNKRAGRRNFFIYYMKNRVQGGKICQLLHEKLLQGGLFFQKC